MLQLKRPSSSSRVYPYDESNGKHASTDTAAGFSPDREAKQVAQQRLLLSTESTEARPSTSFCWALLCRSDLRGDVLQQRRAVCRCNNTFLCQLILLLAMGYVVFGKNVAIYCGRSEGSRPYENGAMIAAMVLLGVDWVLSLIYRPNPSLLGLLLDAVMVALIVVDIDWVSIPISQYTYHTFDSKAKGGQQLASAAILATRSGRMTRLLHLSQIIPVLKVAMRGVQLCGQPRIGRQVPTKPTSIRTRVEELHLYQLVAFFLVTATVIPLLSPVVPNRTLDALLAPFQPFTNTSSDLLSLPPLLPLVQSFFGYFLSRADLKERAMVLVVGDNIFDQSALFGGGVQHANDREWVYAPGSKVAALINVSERNRQAAFWNIWLAVFTIALLSLAVCFMNVTTARVAVSPIERIEQTLQAQAKHILDSLQLNDEDAQNEACVAEAAVQKMSRIVAQHGPTGNLDGHAAQLLQDDRTDPETREWLRGVMNQRQGSTLGLRRASSIARPRKSLVGALARLTKARQHRADEVPDGEASMPSSVREDPAVAEALHMRLLIRDVDPATMDTWDFDALLYTHQQLVAHFCVMFMQQGLCQSHVASVKDVAEAGGAAALQDPATFLQVLSDLEASPSYAGERASLDLTLLWKFAHEVSKSMQAVSYHNFHHVCDVTHCCYRFIRLTEDSICLSHWEQIALLTAALCHDMDHPGVNNAFLVATRHPLAMTYNDAAVLESHHLARMYALLAQEDVAIFSRLDASRWRDLRKMIINCIVHTDMTQHFPLVSKVEVFQELHARGAASPAKASDSRANSAMSLPSFHTLTAANSLFSTPEQRNLLMAVLLHCADIGNSVKPWTIAEKWARRVVTEFFEQGDKERALGLPVSPLMDRDTTSFPLSQINFIEFIVAPLFFRVAKLLPELQPLVIRMTDNLRNWYERWQLELDSGVNKSAADKEADKGKAVARWQAFLKKHEDQLEHSVTASASSSRRASLQPGGSLPASIGNMFRASRTRSRSSSGVGSLLVQVQKARPRSNSGGGAVVPGGLPGMELASAGSSMLPKIFRKRTQSLFSNRSDAIFEGNLDLETGVRVRSLSPTTFARRASASSTVPDDPDARDEGAKPLTHSPSSRVSFMLQDLLPEEGTSEAESADQPQ